MKDWGFRAADLARAREAFADHDSCELPTAAHYIQEDSPGERRHRPSHHPTIRITQPVPARRRQTRSTGEIPTIARGSQPTHPA
jgi:hypothetical protein